MLSGLQSAAGLGPPSLAVQRQQRRRQQFSSTSHRPAAAAAAIAVRTACAASSSGSGDELTPPTSDQAAAADRLLKLSREQPRKGKSPVSDSELRQRILLLLQLGFSETAISKQIQNNGGGPYAAWESVSELVALLLREGFSQKQLDQLLSKGDRGSTFCRAPADVAANLCWLQDTFGLAGDGVALACGRTPSLLVCGVNALQDNWTAIENRYQVPGTAMVAVATSLRSGNADFLLLSQQKVRDQVTALQELLGLSDEQVSARFGRLVRLVHLSVPTLAPRVKQLLELTGVPLPRLARYIVAKPSMLYITEDTVSRNYKAILAAVGDDAAAKLLITRNPNCLSSAVDLMERNLHTLRQPPYGCSPTAAVDVLVKNARLSEQVLDRPAFAARVAFWQQAYACASPEAILLKCVGVMHQKLTTLAPRVAYWRHQRPGQTLPTIFTFTASDATFCSKQRFQEDDFKAFKQRWLASEEGRAVCQHERGSK